MPLGFKRHQFSGLFAKGLRHPKLRADLNVSEQSIHGKPSYVIKVPGENTYFRFGALEYEILTLCDGTRVPKDLADEMSRRHTRVAINEAHVIDFLDTVEASLWECSTRERHLAVLERLRQGRRLRLQHSNVFNIRFPPLNPDRLLTGMSRYCGWVFTRSFVVASVLLLLTTIYLLGANWTRIREDTEALYNFENVSSFDVGLFWVLILILEGLHEFGHGLVCKHFGGEVPEIGFSLVYFTPSLYMDTTDIVLFSRRQRYWVIFAGIWTELVVCGLATLAWAFTLPGTLLNGLAYKTLLLTGLGTLLWNLNPLIQADGYYALSEYWGIDNLAESSDQYLWSWIQKFVLRGNVDLPLASRRDRRILLFYSIAARVNVVFLALASFAFVRNIFPSEFGGWTYFFLAIVVAFLARKYLGRLFASAKQQLAARRNLPMAWKPSRIQTTALLGTAAVVLLPPFPFHVTSDFVLEPVEKFSLRPKVDGKVSEVFVREGDSVRPGQLLARLENPEVEAGHHVLFAELALASGDLRNNEYQYEPVSAAQAARERVRLQSQIAVARERQNSLEIISPADGLITTPLLEQKRGEFLTAGDEFCRIVNRANLRARILVRDWNFQDVKPGAAVALKVPAFPFRTYSGTVDQILPAAALDPSVTGSNPPQRLGQELTNYIALIVVVQNSDGLLREGMTGTARISARRYPLAWLITRGAWRWLRGQVF